MSLARDSVIPRLLRDRQPALLEEWITEQTKSLRSDRISATEVREQSGEFLTLLADAVADGGTIDIQSPAFSRVRETLTSLTRVRGLRGFSPSETATFVFSLKRPLFTQLREVVGSDAGRLADETWTATELLDRLGLFVTEAYQRSREEVIARQQQDMLELSTPVVKLWDGVLALPMIGTLDSQRTQVVMESLLQRIVETGAEIAIIDITGVPTVDALTAQHLLKTSPPRASWAPTASSAGSGHRSRRRSCTSA